MGRDRGNSRALFKRSRVFRSDELDLAVVKAGLGYNEILERIPKAIPCKTNRGILTFGQLSLAIEHYGAILQLVHDGSFIASAYALARPLLEAICATHWLIFAASEADVERAIDIGTLPTLERMLKGIEHLPILGEVLIGVREVRSVLNDFVHGGVSAAVSCLDPSDHLMPHYRDEETIMMLRVFEYQLQLATVGWRAQLDFEAGSDENNS